MEACSGKVSMTTWITSTVTVDVLSHSSLFRYRVIWHYELGVIVVYLIFPVTHYFYYCNRPPIFSTRMDYRRKAFSGKEKLLNAIIIKSYSYMIIVLNYFLPISDMRVAQRWWKNWNISTTAEKLPCSTRTSSTFIAWVSSCRCFSFGDSYLY